MNQTTTQYAKNLQGNDTNLRIVATYGNIAILEDGNSRQEYQRSIKCPIDESLVIDGYYYNPIVNKPLENKEN